MRIRTKHLYYIQHIINGEKVTVSQLEKLIGKSSKTIVKELDELEVVLSNRDIKLIRKQGQGIWIEAKEGKIFELEEEIMNKLNSNSYIGFNLLEMLLHISFKKISSNELSELIFVSPTTISVYIGKLNKYLKDYNVEVVNLGNELKLEGREQNIRTLLFELVSMYVDVKSIISYLNNNEVESRIKFVFDENLKIIKEQVNTFETNMEIKLTDQSFVDLYLHLLITCLRVRNGCTITNYERVRINYIQIKHSDEVLNTYKNIAKNYYFIDLDINEMKYFSFIISSHLSIKIKHTDSNDVLLEEKISNGLKHANYLVNYDLSSDSDLRDGLLNHLEPALNRLANGISTNSPFTSQIKNDYELAYNIAKILILSMQMEYDNHNNVDDEIAQIALHIQASIERYAFEKTKQINVCIVSSSGQGSPQLIKSKLQKQFNNLDKVEILSVFEYYSRPLAIYDLIVSTTYINQMGIPIINVSPLMSYSDLNKISNFLIQNDLNNQVKNGFNSLINKELCIFGQFNSKGELLDKVNDILVERDLVYEDYFKSLLDREKISSTDNTRFAVPHGNPKYVKENRIVIVVSDKKVDWGKHGIDLVIIPLISITSNIDTSRIMNSIFSLKTNEELLENLGKSTSGEQIYEILRRVND